ncbi:MAG TPA: hypothetical protein VKT30_06265 [Caulobacteraceae bacterium]|nr:hypothetical protein [Caulobacteraceae bacterium]
MAKAHFHRNQKVWVETVGTWAVIEKIVPIWARGFDEPVRVTYDVGLGRDFMAHDLRAEDHVDDDDAAAASGWRLMRARNKWQQPEDCGHHPYPGTFPVVVTDKTDWGGWRVPGAEYDRDPRKIEYQARLMVAAPKLLALAQALVALVAEEGDDVPTPIQALAQKAAAVERSLAEIPAAPESAADDRRAAPIQAAE